MKHSVTIIVSFILIIFKKLQQKINKKTLIKINLKKIFFYLYKNNR